MGNTISSGLGSGAHRSEWRFSGNWVLRSFFERSGMCMARLDGGIRLIEANVDFSRQFGRSPTELDGSRFCDLLHQDGRSKVSQQFTRLLAHQCPRFTETPTRSIMSWFSFAPRRVRGKASQPSVAR